MSVIARSGGETGDEEEREELLLRLVSRRIPIQHRCLSLMAWYSQLFWEVVNVS